MAASFCFQWERIKITVGGTGNLCQVNTQAASATQPLRDFVEFRADGKTEQQRDHDEVQDDGTQGHQSSYGRRGGIVQEKPHDQARNRSQKRQDDSQDPEMHGNQLPQSLSVFVQPLLGISPTEVLEFVVFVARAAPSAEARIHGIAQSLEVLLGDSRVLTTDLVQVDASLPEIESLAISRHSGGPCGFKVLNNCTCFDSDLSSSSN
jgi:hypothetical protein